MALCAVNPTSSSCGGCWASQFAGRLGARHALPLAPSSLSGLGKAHALSYTHPMTTPLAGDCFACTCWQDQGACMHCAPATSSPTPLLPNRTASHRPAHPTNTRLLDVPIDLVLPLGRLVEAVDALEEQEGCTAAGGSAGAWAGLQAALLPLCWAGRGHLAVPQPTSSVHARPGRRSRRTACRREDAAPTHLTWGSL